MDDQNRNLILAMVLSLLVFLVWSFIAPPPETDSQAAATESSEAASNAPVTLDETAAAPQLGQAPTATATDTPSTPSPAANAPRIEIASPSLTGSISLLGGRIDDLSLTKYRETLDTESELVRLLSPVGTPLPYYALNGWIPASGTDQDNVPTPETLWTLQSGEVLRPGAPVVLAWQSPAGLAYEREISIDDNYMFTVTQRVKNNSAAAVSLAPFGLVARHGVPDSRSFYILHEGIVRMSDGELNEIDYGDIAGLSADEARIDVTQSGWTGFTDKYWMTALIPSADKVFQSVAREAAGIYRAETIYAPIAIEPGASAESSERIFAGAKEWEVIKAYEEQGNISGFIDSIDWGWFFFLTKPIFRLLHWLNGQIGNMGWSIIALTLIIKAILFPLAYKSYASMAKMRELQPEMEKLKERAGDDREAMQKGMMELYRKEKVNPASGCLPILLQIPIFFSLYKVIFVTLELRHAPWIGWIRDLSAPDPSSILNLFGLLPFTAPEPGSLLAIISLGILPILLGISMFLQQKLNPAPTDATQKMIFAWMPWVFMFMLGGFASGLVIYWIANNTITFIQQYIIMRRHGYHPDIIGNIIGNPHEGRDKKPKDKS